MFFFFFLLCFLYKILTLQATLHIRSTPLLLNLSSCGCFQKLESLLKRKKNYYYFLGMLLINYVYVFCIALKYLSDQFSNTYIFPLNCIYKSLFPFHLKCQPCGLESARIFLLQAFQKSARTRYLSLWPKTPNAALIPLLLYLQEFPSSLSLEELSSLLAYDRWNISLL